MPINTSILPNQQWLILASEHKSRVLEYTEPYRKRKSKGESHPVLDFLFSYYSFSIGRLESWHPSLGTHLEIEGDTPSIFLDKHYSRSNNYLFHDTAKLSKDRLDSIQWMITLLKSTRDRPPIFSCFGMHEWAMVYKGHEIRHEKSVTLRLTQEETDSFVKSRPILCSHFDAFRFFSPAAMPLNKLQPQKEGREDLEQPGCIHANMDLYKWAYKCMPWVGSELLWKTFLLALKMRELDMRASPYDLEKFNYLPIKVETPAGRQEYESYQRQLANEAKPLRQELIDTLSLLVSSSKIRV